MHGKDAEDTTLGYNGQVAVGERGFVLEMQAYTGATPDGLGVAALVGEQRRRQGFTPRKLIYDRAAGTGKVHAQVAAVSEGKTQLSAPPLPDEKRTARFTPLDFTLTPDGQGLTCPAGQTTYAGFAAPKGEGRLFRYYDHHCWQGELPKGKRAPDPARAQRCPLWEHCRDAKQGPRSTRQVFVSDDREEVQQALRYQQTEAYRQDRKQRAKVEQGFAALTRYNGARRCRSHGLQKADWQAKLCAVAYNLKRPVCLLSVPARPAAGGWAVAR